MLKPEAKKLNFARLRPFLTPGVIVLAVLVSAFLLVKPRIDKIFLLQRELSQKEEKLAQLTAKTAAIEGLDETELSSRVDLVAKAFPNEKDFPLFLSLLRKLVNKNNLELTTLQVNPGEIATASAQTKKGKLPLLAFMIGVKGQMNGFREFVYRVSQTAPLMVIRDFQVKTQEGGSLEVTLLIEAPFLPLPATLGRIEKALAQINSQEEEAYQELTRLDFSLIEETPLSFPTGKDNPFSF
jgi:Tfp pilus assembly protein PilO